MIMLNNNDQPRKAVPETTEPSPESAAEHKRLDELLDEGLKDTFPASDPVASAGAASTRIAAAAVAPLRMALREVKSRLALDMGVSIVWG